MGKLMLIDGHSILHRAYYGVPDLTNAEGLHTNAVFGFLNIMFRLLDEEKPDYLAIAFDLGEPTFRHQMYKEYKANRNPMPPELFEQVDLIKKVLASMEIPILTMAGFEADDILGTVAKQTQEKGEDVVVISGDRDLLQLADKKIKIRIPKTSKGVTEVFNYYPEDVKQEYGVTPEEFIEVKALMGDSSDNIPGVPSIGQKTATAIIAAYHSIENAYAHLEEIKPPRAKKALGEHYDTAQFCRKLVTICTSCGISFSLQEAKLGNLYTQEAFQIIKDLDFKSFLSRFAAEASENIRLEEHFTVTDKKKTAESWVKRASALAADKEGRSFIGMQIFAAQKKVEEEQISFSFGDGNELGLGQKDEEETRGLSITGLAISL